MTTIDNTLAERGKTHGCFEANAIVSQGLKAVLHDLPSFHDMAADKQEAIDMICLKLSRIVTGNSSEPDHWRDIEGYAALVRKRLEGQQ